MEYNEIEILKGAFGPLLLCCVFNYSVLVFVYVVQ